MRKEINFVCVDIRARGFLDSSRRLSFSFLASRSFTSLDRKTVLNSVVNCECHGRPRLFANESVPIGFNGVVAMIGERFRDPYVVMVAGSGDPRAVCCADEAAGRLSLDFPLISAST